MIFGVHSRQIQKPIFFSAEILNSCFRISERHYNETFTASSGAERWNEHVTEY